MSGYTDPETVFDSIHPGEAEVPQSLPRYSKHLNDPGSSKATRSLLEDAIRRVALPRLLAARMAETRVANAALSSICEHDIRQMMAHVTSSDHHIAEASMMVLALRGVSREDILLNLFPPVAARLHEEWGKDSITFADVTLAISRLQRLIGSSAMPQPALHGVAQTGKILITQLPGDAHSLCAVILEDFFRSALWETARCAPKSETELAERIGRARYDVLAISISRNASLSSVALLVRRLRRESVNTRIAILVGGQPLLANPGTWKRTGADATAPDPACAVAVANTLLQTMLHEP